MRYWAGESDAARAAVDDALGIEGFALNRYCLQPGDGLPSGLHTHLDQAEVFVVLSGKLRFETLDGDVAVEAGEAVRFAPGEYQTGANAGDEPAVVLAVGAPQKSDEVRVPLPCPDCGHEALEPNWRDGEVVLDCPDCRAGHRTHGCPECGRAEVTVRSDGEGGTVVRCPDCGAERAQPCWRESG